MAQKVFILGDSFGDAKWPVEHDTRFVWPHKLSEQYNVVNLACVGTGPDNAIDKLLKIINDFDKEELANSYLIFIHSDVNRLNLNCYKNEYEQSHVYAIAEGKIKHQSHMFLKQAFKWYMVEPGWGFQQYIKNFCTVKHISQFFKSVLFWPIRSFVDNANSPVHTLDFYKETDDNMTAITRGLYEISTIDCGENLQGLAEDPRPNHLQEINHIIMHDELVNWIEKAKTPDTSRFQFCGKIKAESDSTALRQFLGNLGNG